MITVYKTKAVAKEQGPVVQNDIFFNQHTVELLDERAADIIRLIDHSEMVSPYAIKSRFDGGILNIDKLSSGCKTVLNIMYNLDKVFDIRECGDNALDVIYTLPEGNVCCEYPFISFDMTRVNVCDGKGVREIDSYEELKDWWTDED